MNLTIISKASLLLLVVILTGCASMLPYSMPTSQYDEFQKTWTITSTQWGLDRTNIGKNLSFMRAFILPNGEVTAQIYADIDTKDLMSPSYALDIDGNRYDAKQVTAEPRCYSASSCYWKQDVIISIDYKTIANNIDKHGDFKLRVYGRTQPEDVLVFACQYWEVTKEVFRIKNIDLGEKRAQMGTSCTKQS